MRQARQRIAGGGSVINTSVQTFMEFVENNPNIFRLLLRALRRLGCIPSGGGPGDPALHRRADRLSGATTQAPREEAYIQAEGHGDHRLQRRCRRPDMTPEECKALSERTISQLRMIAMGAEVQNRKRHESLT